MQVFKSLKEVPETSDYGLTIGNFDGVHIGHQKLLKQIKEECRQKGLKLIVVTFVPHPLAILRNEKSFLLNTYEERKVLLRNLGIEFLVELPFTRDFSTLTPANFLDQHILINDHLKLFFLGYDFAFGANKEGDHSFVADYCKGRSLEVIVQKKVETDVGTYSSSLARKFLSEGDPEGANSILGRPFFLKGRVIKGAGRGRQIGFPTANIEFDFSRITPQKGVYSTICTFRGCDYLSITNIGNNPTFNNNDALNVETNIFDFDQDIYGEEIQVNFYKKIREEKKFNSVNELIAQISKDVAQRRSFGA